MKKHFVIYYIVCVVMALACAAAIGFGIFACIGGKVAVGAVLLMIAVGFALALAAMILRESLEKKCYKMFEEKKYAEERAYLEKVRKGPLSFLTRIPAMTNYVCVCMALDDLPSALRIIERLRHGGGAGWKYQTAYCYILIRLDGGDLEAAREEYEEFRTQCAKAEIYRDQIEVLTAIFHRLFKTNNAEPLPEAAVDSPYPVVGRILGRAYEQHVAESEAKWD